MNQTGTERKAILYFGNDWYAENRTSSHHIARLLAEKHDVYYFTCPGMRAPTASGRDVRRIFQKLGRALAGSRQVLPGLWVQTLLQVPFHRFRLIRWLNQWLLLWMLRWFMWRRGIKRPVAWFVVPHAACLVGRLGECASVYYVTDDHASLPGVEPASMRAMDEHLTRKADLVFVASDTLLAAKAAMNPRTFHSPHGVDVEHFGRAQVPGTISEDVAGLARPVVGFFGLIERWIDLSLVAYLAKQRPNWSFLMIGRTAVPADELPTEPNIYFIGRRPYEQLPDYGRLFDACIIPYKLNKQVMHANPLKLREYLAMGKPIVAVRTPEIEKYADVVAIADTPEEFLARLDETLSHQEPPDAPGRRMARVASSSWKARVDWLLGKLTERVDGCSSGRSLEPVPGRKS